MTESKTEPKTFLDIEKLKDAWACTRAAENLLPLESDEDQPAYKALYAAAADAFRAAGMELYDALDAYRASAMFYRHHPDWGFTVWLNRLMLYGFGCFTLDEPKEEEDERAEDE